MPPVCDDRPMSASLYESHVTVRCSGPDESARLGRWAAAGGFKLTHIVLAELRGCEVLSVEREFVLHDSDVSVDEGWLEEPVGVRT